MARRLFLLLCCALLAAACGRSERHQPLAAGTRVLAFGDSVTFGTGAAPGEDYPTRLAALSRWDIVNAGIPGEMTDAAKGRIAAVLEETRPALVLIELGGNDFLRHRPEAGVKDNLRQIIAAVRQAGAQPVLIAVPGLSIVGAAVGGLSDADLYEALGKEEKLPVVADVMASVLSDPTLRSDPVHPNAEGYRRFAEGVAAALAKAGFLLPG